jgi:mannose-6-phosphate isomerase-like protein (cupin superfamily)
VSDDWRITLEAFQNGVATSVGRAFVGLRHGTMRTLLYAPQVHDDQAPHKQDEIYIIQSGHGRLRKGAETRAFGPGDVLFVEAEADHRFEDFSEDFAAWAIFWGPTGGEG